MRAVIFDLDGVISNTAAVHEKAWTQVFNETLTEMRQGDRCFTHDDYKTYVDGKSRVLGIQSFLQARGLELNSGPKDTVDVRFRNGIANRKNGVFLEMLAGQKDIFFSDALRLIDGLREKSVPIAIGSSSKNAVPVLQTGKLVTLFDVIVDGKIAESKNIASKPDPEFYSYCAKKLDQRPENCIVIEDAVSGIVSAVGAGIGKVIAVARENNIEECVQAGAHEVVTSLDELRINELITGR